MKVIQLLLHDGDESGLVPAQARSLMLNSRLLALHGSSPSSRDPLLLSAAHFYLLLHDKPLLEPLIESGRL